MFLLNLNTVSGIMHAQMKFSKRDQFSLVLMERRLRFKFYYLSFSKMKLNYFLQ